MGLGIALGITSVIGGLAGSSSSSTKAKKAGKIAANLVREETAEELRRMDRDFAQLEGRAVTSVGASGIHMDGSSLNVIKDMESEFGRQREWTERSGEMRAKQARSSGNATASNIRYSGLSQAVGGLNTIGSSQGWWK